MIAFRLNTDAAVKFANEIAQHDEVYLKKPHDTTYQKGEYFFHYPAYTHVLAHHLGYGGLVRGYKLVNLKEAKAFVKAERLKPSVKQENALLKGRGDGSKRGILEALSKTDSPIKIAFYLKDKEDFKLAKAFLPALMEHHIGNDLPVHIPALPSGAFFYKGYSPILLKTVADGYLIVTSDETRAILHGVLPNKELCIGKDLYEDLKKQRLAESKLEFVIKPMTTRAEQEGCIGAIAPLVHNLNKQAPHQEDRTNPDYYKIHPSGVECIEITRHYNFLYWERH